MSKRMLLIALVSLTALASFASFATAGRLSTAERRFDVIWSELEVAEFAPIMTRLLRCPVTLSGRFESATFRKTVGQIGQITTATIEVPTCAEGSFEPVRTSLPWPVRYESFGGTLPNITGINVRITRSGWRIFGMPECEIASEETRPIRATFNREVAGFVITRLTPDATARITGVPAPACGTFAFSGEGTVSKLGSTDRFRVTLI